MSTKEFVVYDDTRVIGKNNTRTTIMQYDLGSETFSFDFPLEIDGHDISTCDVLQLHFENASTGTSASTRKYSRKIVDFRIKADPEDPENNPSQVEIDTANKKLYFNWLVPQEATMYAGKLSFQLVVIGYGDGYDENGKRNVVYRWSTSPNNDVSIVAGLGLTADEIPASLHATLQSLQIVDTDEGIEVILDGWPYTVRDGYSGVYVGDSEEDWPANSNVWIDPNGAADSEGDIFAGGYVITQTIDGASSDNQIPSAKAVFSLLASLQPIVNTDGVESVDTSIERILNTDVEV